MKKAFTGKAFRLLNNKKCSKTNSSCADTDRRKKNPKPPAPKGEYSIHPALSRKNLDVPKEVDPPSKLARGELYKPYAVAPGPASKRGGLQTVCFFHKLLLKLKVHNSCIYSTYY